MHDTIAALITSTLLINREMHVDDTYHRLTGRHFPSLKKAAPDAIDKRPRKPCRVCTTHGNKTLKGKPLKIVYICKECPSEPYFCFSLENTVFLLLRNFDL